MMRTLSLTKVNMTRRTCFVVILLLAFAMAFIIATKPVNAATLDGEYTLDNNFSNVTTKPVNLEPTQFELYKVGSFVSGSPYVKLDSPYDELGVNLPLDADKTDQVAWTKEWLLCANTLYNNLPADADAIEFTSDKDGHFSKSGLGNGIYLLAGKSQIIRDYPKVGQKSYWWPQPMLVSILNKDTHVNVKPMTGSTGHLKVRKDWQGIDESIKDLVKPDSITVKIYYGSKDGEPRYTEVLNDENDWSFSWDPADGEEDPSQWFVEEVVDESVAAEFYRNFSVTIGENFVSDPNSEGDLEVLTITNKYDRYELEIEKTLDAYVDHGENNSTSLVFELMGYDDSGLVYHKFVGMQFDAKSKDSQKLPVKDIPRGLTKLIVKEVYSGNYNPEAFEMEAELVESETDEKGVYQVSFSNMLGNTTHGSGVINKFKIKDNAFKFDKSLGAGK